ncbi:hypothetical protein QGM71_18310 [Virgibacillus sp. C22-A2]|uniref:Uncharacterized protein n=1 Tax=Virgibacillus tibetensis TaxID=3042313 RepID=A0ABU6KJS1_9BACI|nr:hypothetical protein [Virgibacillus sp. C22-A2]
MGKWLNGLAEALEKIHEVDAKQRSFLGRILHIMIFRQWKCQLGQAFQVHGEKQSIL